MDSLSNPPWEALTPATHLAFQCATQFPAMEQFYLAGGTGLALHLGHRFSVNLDFFSEMAGSVGADQRASLREIFDDPTLTITYDQDATFVATWKEVGISFFRLPLYPLVQAPLLVEGIRLATIPEIGAMKLAAMMDRGTRKDLVDMYFILQNVPLETVFEVAAVKYAKIRSFPVSATRALAYFADAEIFPMPQMLVPTPWSKMKKFLEQQALEVGKKRLGDLWQ
ncbi:MAG: hypothetical protein Fur0022_30240 [Anaerolineales bacterium]